ncbi:hypothetical protein HYY71_02735, partial [Candidatus Woesearchaeota archaeon]|nr:hypothetical protein [Candidatus Woesearchaeota archaeon]
EKIQTPQGLKEEQKDIISGCVTVNKCRQWHAAADPNKGGGIQIGNKIIKGYTIQRLGYTKGCFFDGNADNIGIVSETDPNTRKECCCINGKTSNFLDIYYTPQEVDPNLEKYLPRNQPVHQSKTKLLEAPQKTEKDPAGYSDMDWSYRYSRIGYLGKKYNPNRYITGRDLPACFGQNNLYYQLLDKEKEILIIDPAKQDLAKVIPCVYLVGVNQWLQRIKVIANAMSKCLIDVRTTGRADSGVCKEIMTQHLCDAFWQVLRFAIDGCTPDYIGPGDPDERDARFTEDIKPLIKSISDGISEAQKEISEDYSNAKLNDLLGAGEESITRKVCLFAFGYDWEINPRNLIDAAYSAPTASLVLAATRSRDFRTIDPQTLKPKYEYKASWIIDPGCDLERYDIKLACVSRNEADKYPNQISCGSVGSGSIAYTGQTPLLGATSSGYTQCDCLELGKEELAPESFFSETNIKQNQLKDRSHRKLIDSNRRYDHLKFILRTDRKVLPSARPKCFPTGNDDGVFYFPIVDKTAKDIADCTVDFSLGLINCGSAASFFSRKGIAELVKVTIWQGDVERIAEDGKTITLDAGEPLKVGARVRKTGQDKCLKVSISSGEVNPQYELITENSTQDIPAITLTSSLAVSGRPPRISPTSGIDVKEIELRNDQQIKIPIDFYDFPEDGDGRIDLSENSEDKVKIGNQPIKDVKDFIKGGKFIIEGQNYKIEIVRVELPRDSVSRLVTREIDLGFGKKKYPFKEGTVEINPPGPTPGPETQQRKTVLVELLHTREDSQGTVSDCNDDDVIIKKPYTIVIQPKRVAASEQAPEIGRPSIESVNPRRDKNIRKGDSVEITSKITDRSRLENVRLVIKGQKGNDVIVQPQQPVSNNYKFIFNTNNAQVAGKYTGYINATNQNGKSSEKAIPEFNIQCGQGDTYGLCREDKCILNNREIRSELDCPGKKIEPATAQQPATTQENIEPDQFGDFGAR